MMFYGTSCSFHSLKRERFLLRFSTYLFLFLQVTTTTSNAFSTSLSFFKKPTTTITSDSTSSSVGRRGNNGLRLSSNNNRPLPLVLLLSSSSLYNDLEMERCYPPFETIIYDFYRNNNFHQQRNKKCVPALPKEKKNKDPIDNDHDVVYTLKSSSTTSIRISNNNNGTDTILASLRLTRSKQDAAYTFLRSLCVSREYRRHGLALRLLKDSLQDFETEFCYCFASPDLELLYEQAGFVRISTTTATTNSSSSMCDDSITTTSTNIPKWLVHSYDSMKARWSPKPLGLFVKSPLINNKQQQ